MNCEITKELRILGYHSSSLQYETYGLSFSNKCFDYLHFEGVPQPKVTWYKKKGILQINSFLSLNGSLFLRNVSYEDAGTYTCRATNALGKAEASSVIHLTGKC